MKIRIVVFSTLLLLTGASCSSPQAQEPFPTQSKVSKASTKEALISTPSLPSTASPNEDQADQPPVYGYTNQRADGNRLAEGQGQLPNATHIDVPLDGTPLWVVAVPMESETGPDSTSLWTVVLDDGSTQSFILEDGVIQEIQPPPSMAEPNPPLLYLADDLPEFLRPPDSAPELAPPAIINELGNWVYTDENGDLVFMLPNGAETGRLAVDALPDGRILVDDVGRLLLLTQPTTRYGHGVLGDAIEAGAVTLIETEPEPKVLATITIEEPLVIEGIAPLWADINGDGLREIVVTVSDDNQGAQLVAYNEEGSLAATGPAIGQGYRWRHQLAVAPFGPGGEMEIVDVLTPHIGGVVEYYRLDGNDLVIVAQVPGFTSHVIGSRNLDMGAAGDFDGDGRIELLLPNQARTELGAIARTTSGAEVLWTIPLDGKLNSNLVTVTLANGQLIAGAGREDGTLRIWP